MYIFRSMSDNTSITASRLAKMVLSVALWANITVAVPFNVWASTPTSLAPQEQQLAAQLANNQSWQQQRATLPSTPHQLGIQTLSIELDEQKKGERKHRARVYQFNYYTQQSRLVLIDLESAVVVKQHPIDTVHLPLNAAEIDITRTLIEQHIKIMEKINHNQTQRGKPPLANLSQIDVKASIFEPGNHTHTCAKQRCALISLFDKTRTVLTVEPVVNLQTMTVTTLQPNH